MITRHQMKVDLTGQVILLVLCVLFLIFSRNTWAGASWGIGFLLFWQSASAAYYWRTYRYREREPAFWILAIIFLLIFLIELSPISFLLLGLPVLGYILLTLRDTLRVYRRPRSFWDLG